MKEFISKNALYGAFAIALMAVIGSMYFSQIANFAPCELCWYQRITTFPLALIIGFAIYKRSREMILPGIALVGIGWLIGIYHNLLYYKIIPEALAPCTAGVSCTSHYIQILGFLDIPQLAFLGSSAILVLLIIYWKSSKKELTYE